MDKVDLKLLELLKSDSRTPLKLLAAKVGLARSTVQERIQKLERRGIIRSYTITTEVPETSCVEAYMLIRTEAPSCHEIAENILKLEGIIQCRSIAGEQDLIVLVQQSTSDQLAKIRNEMAQINGVIAIESHVVLNDWVSDRKESSKES